MVMFQSYVKLPEADRNQPTDFLTCYFGHIGLLHSKHHSLKMGLSMVYYRCIPNEITLSWETLRFVSKETVVYPAGTARYPHGSRWLGPHLLVEV